MLYSITEKGRFILNLDSENYFRTNHYCTLNEAYFSDELKFRFKTNLFRNLFFTFFYDRAFGMCTLIPVFKRKYILNISKCDSEFFKSMSFVSYCTEYQGFKFSDLMLSYKIFVSVPLFVIDKSSFKMGFKEDIISNMSFHNKEKIERMDLTFGLHDSIIEEMKQGGYVDEVRFYGKNKDS